MVEHVSLGVVSLVLLIVAVRLFRLSRGRPRVPSYVEAHRLMQFCQRYAYDEMLEDKQRRAYQHVIAEIGRMEWYR